MAGKVWRDKDRVREMESKAREEISKMATPQKSVVGVGAAKNVLFCNYCKRIHPGSTEGVSPPSTQRETILSLYKEMHDGGFHSHCL